jgi:inosine-uridine nucleoside N-ribohydrolase
MPIPIIFDTDPGHDDAFALLLANKSPELKILAVTTIAANQTIDKVTLNARRIMTIGGMHHIPLAQGMAGPLMRELHTAPQAHGVSGLDGYDFGEPTVNVVSEHAVDLIIRTVRQSPEPVTLVPVGAFTNIATAFMLAPDIKQNISRIVMMGGAWGVGNVTPAAEFNVYVDPEAAQAMFHSGLPITMVGLDVTHKALAYEADRQRIAAFGTPVGDMVAGLMEWYAGARKRRTGEDGAAIHDALAVACAFRPDLIETKHVNVEVECSSKYNDGRTVCDLLGNTGRAPNADVAISVNRAAFIELFIERLSQY